MEKLQPEHKRFYLNRNLIIVVLLFIVAASGLVVLTNFSINMMAATHDFTSLLSKRSQYHRQAGILLESYAQSGNREDYRAYQRIIKEGNKLERAISEIININSNPERAFRIIHSEKIHPNEISKLIFAFQQFSDNQSVKNIRRLWQEMKKIEASLNQSIKVIHNEWQSGQAEPVTITRQLANISALNMQRSKENMQLMEEVQTASLSLKQMSLWMSVALGILLVLIGVVFTVRANKSIGRWEQTLDEKQVMLAEIHHRVKNNLAVISGFLELESMQGRQTETALQESRDRIKSMAMIHEILYRSDSFSEINLGEYMKRLIHYIDNMHLDECSNVRIETDLDHVNIGINQAVPLGLLVNELLSNAIKHGFKKNEQGKINIKLKETGSQVYVSISDNGKGLPPNFDLNSTETLGLTIIKALAKQLDADLNIEEGSGVRAELQFQKSLPNRFIQH